MNDLTGMRFGRLVILCFAYKDSGYHSFWKCQCDCGNTKNIRSDHLFSGASVSCGCYRSEFSAIQGKSKLTKHGWYGTKLYARWIGMRERCSNPNVAGWKNYGGRGISVCQEWYDSFESFKDWALANGYKEDAPRGECTLDRINPNGNYEPSNCRWLTIFEQQSNKRNNHWVTYLGKQYTVSQISRKFGICGQTLVGRIEQGMTVEEALAKPYKHISECDEWTEA